ncbi:hypothetical protein BC351_00445 [Paenibacillus ferrarius]|uniref:Actin-like protein N-terminal domain-containing protein n=1 Tax=Paenibacillus ferrarius TaxID=1469647 RepID=A0A1V4HT48_9BACL|nr:hypothetical protein [Paenibacillus ferrarius]OPH61745.1 hypothetical protein BC351_00445 [Paenibacillus ferrarius]
MLTVGADIGKYRTKIKWKGGVQGHLSKIATYREIKDNIQLDDNNLIIEYNNQMYFAGDLADREGQNFLNSEDMGKSNLVTHLNLLVELSRLPCDVFNLVVGNPFGINTKKERENLKNLLSGYREFKVNEKPFKLHIRNVGVCPEGLSAYYSDANLPDDCNIWDFGSSTIHGISVRKRKLIDKRSKTFEFGFESMVDHDCSSLMLSLKNQMEKRWNDSTSKKMLLIGGKAPDMFKYVRDIYPESNPTIHNNYEYANAIGNFALGERAYG